MKRNRKRNLRKSAKGSRYQAKQAQHLVYEPLESRKVLTAGTGFDTIGASQSDPAITSTLANSEGDVGPNHFVEFGEQTFTVFDRAGEIVESSTLNQFFIDAGNELFGENVINPRVIFDRASERWIAVATGDNSGPLAGNFIHIAVSQTSDPTGQWEGVQFIPTDTGTLLSTEISLGIDDAGVFLATRNVQLDQLGVVNAVPDSVSIFSIPRIDLFGPGTPTVLNLTEFADLDPEDFGERIQFASNFDTQGDGVVFAFSEENAQELNTFQISNAGIQAPQSAVLSAVTQITIDSNNNPDPNIFIDPMAPPVFGEAFPTLNPTVNVNGQLVGEEVVHPNGLTSSLFEIDGSIFGVRTVTLAFNPTADFRTNGINFFELEVDGTGNPPTLANVPGFGNTSHIIVDRTPLGDNNLDFVPEFGATTFFNPSISYQADSELITVVYNGVSQFDAVNFGVVALADATRISTFASVGFRVNNAADGVDADGNPLFPRQNIQLEEPQILNESIAPDAFNPIGQNFFGAYSSVRPDPSNPNGFFATIPFVEDVSDQFDVQVVEILPFDLVAIVEGTDDGDVIIVRRNPSDTDFVEVEINGVINDQFDTNIFSQLIIFGNGGDDQIIIDHTNGDPTLSEAFIIDAGSGVDSIETNTTENVEFLINSLNAAVNIPFPAYLAENLIDAAPFPLNDDIGPADGFLTPLTLAGVDIAEIDLVSTQLIDIEEVISGSGDDTFIFQVGPLGQGPNGEGGSASGRDGDDRFVFVGGGSVDGSINGGTGFNTLDLQQRGASTNIEIFQVGAEAGFNGRTISGPVGQFAEILDQFRDISLIRGSTFNFNDSLQALASVSATFTIVTPDILPDDIANPANAESFVASRYEASGRTLFFTDFDVLFGSVVDDQFNVQSNNDTQLAELILNGRTGDDEFNFSSDSPINEGNNLDNEGLFFVEGGGGENTINVSEFSQTLPQDYLILNARISGPVEVVYTDTNGGNFEVNLDGSNTEVDTFFLQSFLASNTLNVSGLGGDDIFVIQDLSQAEVNLFGGVGDDTYIIESVGPVDDRDVIISDSINAENDTVLIAGTINDEQFIVDVDSFESDQFLFIGVEQFGFDGRGGDDEFFVRGISADFPIILIGDDGNDTFYISSDAPVNLGDLTTINNDLIIDAGTGANQILISNEDGAALDAVIRNNEITGLFNSGTLTFTSEGGNFELIDITGSNGGDDRFLIESLFVDDNLSIDGRLGQDEFIIGDGLDIEGSNVLGQVTVDGASDGDSYTVFLAGEDLANVTILDSGFSGTDEFIVTGTNEADSFQLDQTQLTTQIVSLDIGSFIENYTFNGLAGDDVFIINNDNAQLISLAGNSGDDTFIINDTDAIVNAAGNDGNDSFSVFAFATGSVNLDGNDGSDTFAIDFIGTGSRQVSLVDSGTSGQDVAQLNGTSFDDVFFVNNSVVGLASETATHGNTIEDISIGGAGGNDVFNVQAATFDLALDGGLGNDQFNLSSNAPFQTGNAQAITGDVIIEGGAGLNELRVTNANAAPANITVTTTSITGVTGGLLSYTSTGGVFARPDGVIGGIEITGSNDASVGDNFNIASLNPGDTIRVLGLGGDDTFDIGNGISGDALLDGGNGSDVYNFQFGTSQQREIIINDTGTTGSDSLNLVGSNDDDNILIDSTGVSDGLSSLTFNIPLNEIAISGLSGNDTFTIDGGPISNISLSGNDGVDTFIVNGTAGIDDLNLFGGTQNDSFIFNVSADPSRIDAFGGTGNDTFTVGQFASGDLNLDGEDGSDQFTVSLLGSGDRTIDTRDSGNFGVDSTTVLGTSGADRIALRTTRVLYDDELVIFDENTERVTTESGAGNDRIVLFGSRSAVTEVFAGAGADTFIINSGARADLINLLGEAGNDRFVVNRTSAGTTTNLFGNDGNDRFSIGSTVSADDGNLGLIRGELNVNGGTNTAGGEDQLVANDNGAFAQYSYSITPDRISPIAGPANLPRTNFIGINFESNVEFVRLDGTPLANLFEVQASPTTRFFIDGNEPTSNLGDQLVVVPSASVSGFVFNESDGSGTVNVTGNQIIQFTSIETPTFAQASSETLPEDDGNERRDELFASGGMDDD